MFRSLPTLFRNALFLRLIVFLLLFILVSGIIGPWVIGTKLLYVFYFFIYGNMGKMVLFSAIAFYLLTRDSLHSSLQGKNRSSLRDHEVAKQSQSKLTFRKYDIKNLFYLLGSIFLVYSFFPIAHVLLTYSSFFSNLPLSLLAHAIVIAIPILLAFGVFSQSFVVQFVKTFKKALLVCLGLSAAFYFAIFYVWQFWPYLSSLVLHVEYFLFSLSFANVRVIPPQTLFVQNFGVSIGAPCSGLDSLLLFTGLYLFIGLLDWKILNHKKLVGMFFLAGIGLFLVNILRVYLLILAGVFISPVITAQLFHTYLGMVLFIIYFALFWKLLYRWMLE